MAIRTGGTFMYTFTNWQLPIGTIGIIVNIGIAVLIEWYGQMDPYGNIAILNLQHN
jgi:hypothetical protein